MVATGKKIRKEIRFVLNDRDVCLAETAPSDTLLDYLRLECGLRGTKEGCAEGDCGACTVLVGRLHHGSLRYETVNACIRLLPSVNGCHVVTVEHLRGTDGGLNPVQQALVNAHGSQCGFCTPGIVMSLYALWMEQPDPDVYDVETALQGNLCRCTGYLPIIRAAISARKNSDPASDVLVAEQDNMTRRLQALQDGCRVEVSSGNSKAVLPANSDDLAVVLREEPGATIVAGATDVGLWVTKHMRDISPAVFVGHLDDLKAITLTDQCLTLGGGVTYTECETAMIEAFPHLSEFWPRIGGQQVRNMGTIGGNIANGSPIGDTPPILISLGAEVTVRRADKRRTMALETFFIDYGKQDLAADEFVEEILVPRLTENTRAIACKISKRRDEDISTVCLGGLVTFDGDRVRSVRLAFGGMAATPKRATAAENALAGQPWSEAGINNAIAALKEDFTPLDDWRGSAEYRMLVAGNLLRRFFAETTGDSPGSAPSTPVQLSTLDWRAAE